MYYEYDGLRQATLSGGDAVTVSDCRAFDVYTIDGRALRAVNSLQELPRGIYIINRRKVLIR